jgi:hypothetical protein
VLIENEHQPPSIQSLWRQLDELEEQLQREESAPCASEEYSALAHRYNRKLFEACSRARAEMGGRHE